MLKLLSLNQSNFKKNVAVLMSGPMLTQALVVIVSPVLTRLYSPEQFGVLALFVAIFSSIGIIASLRFEMAVVQPDDDIDAISLFWVSLIIIVLISLLSMGGVLVYQFFPSIFFGGPQTNFWTYFIPLSLLFSALIQLMNRWVLRKEMFTDMAATKFLQGFSTSFFQVVMGVFALTGGLIWGLLIGQLMSFVYLLSRLFFQTREVFTLPPWPKIRDNIHRYKKMPLYSTPGAMANGLSLQMPILVLGRFFSEHIIGIFGLTFRVLYLPMSVLSAALSQVLFKEVADLKNTDSREISFLVFKVSIALLILMVPFVILMTLFSVPLFSFVFGETWKKAGELAGILVFAAAIRFIVSPLSIIMAMNENVKLGSAWQFLYLVTISLTLLWAGPKGVEFFVYAFVIHELILYSIYYVLILVSARKLDRKARDRDESI